MPYDLSIDDVDRIAVIRLRGDMPHAEHLKAREELLAACRARAIRKILVDARELACGSTTTMELFDFGVSWTEFARRTPLTLAGVLPRDASSRQDVEFGRTVSANRGFMTRAFADVEEARKWLRTV